MTEDTKQILERGRGDNGARNNRVRDGEVQMCRFIKLAASRVCFFVIHNFSDIIKTHSRPKLREMHCIKRGT